MNRPHWRVIRWTPYVSLCRFRIRPLYARYANAGKLWWLGIAVTWRLPWLPDAAYEQGHEAAWRDSYREIRHLRSEIQTLRECAQCDQTRHSAEK